MNYYLIINGLGEQPVKSKTPIRHWKQAKIISTDNSCYGVIIISPFTYLIKKIQWNFQKALGKHRKI